MAYENLSAAELFEARRRIVLLGIDHRGVSAGEQESMEIMDILQLRRLVSPESIEEYDKGLRTIESATTYEEMYNACDYFQKAIKISDTFMNAHANLTGVLGDMGNYTEAIRAGDVGRQYGFFFDLEYNRCKAMLLVGRQPSEYCLEIVGLLNVIEECVRHGESILSRHGIWDDEKRFAKSIRNQCRQVGYVAGMSENQRDELESRRYDVSATRRAVNILGTFVYNLCSST